MTSRPAAEHGSPEHGVLVKPESGHPGFLSYVLIGAASAPSGVSTIREWPVSSR
jgi:hypothetical protein